MRHLSIVVFFLFSLADAYSNEGRDFISSKGGVTIISFGGYEDTVQSKRTQDAFLDLVLKTIGRQKKGLKILVLIDQYGVYTKRRGFASIAYDTLRNADMMFIEDYYSYREDSTRYLSDSGSVTRHLKDLPVPLDLNSSYEDDQAEVGLKIIFNHSHFDSSYQYDKILSIIKYGVDHIEEIKRKQTRIIMPTGYNRRFISLLTLDTNEIQKIKTLNIQFPANSKNLYRILLSVIIFSTILVAGVVIMKVRSTSKQPPT